MRNNSVKPHTARDGRQLYRIEVEGVKHALLFDIEELSELVKNIESAQQEHHGRNCRG